MIEIEDIKSILVIGAGSMGHSIAQVYAQGGFNVDLVDVNQKKLEHAIKLIKANLEVLSEFDMIQKNDINNITSKIHTSTDLEESATDKLFVLEAVNEIPDLKKNIFEKLAKLCSEETVLASNTSTLDIFGIVKGIKNRERIIAQHWFSPPHIIPTVEIVPGRKTSEKTLTMTIDLTKKIGKVPIIIKKFSPSYIVNKIQSVISGAMYELMARGIATADQIDLAIKTTLGIRLPIVGIVQSQDFTGLDVVSDIQKSMGGNFPLIQEKVQKNQLGVKTGKGFYDYYGQTEEEILKKRDRLYIQQLKFLEESTQFKPI